MATKKATLYNLGDVLAEDLLDWNSQVKGELQTGIKAIAVNAKLMIQDSAPTRPGHGEYKRSWRVSRDRRARKDEVIYIVHANAPYYRLTHLLEKGHIVRNRKNGPILGHADPIEHIAPAEARAEQLTMELVDRVFKAK